MICGSPKDHSTFINGYIVYLWYYVRVFCGEKEQLEEYFKKLTRQGWEVGGEREYNEMEVSNTVLLCHGLAAFRDLLHNCYPSDFLPYSVASHSYL